MSKTDKFSLSELRGIIKFHLDNDMKVWVRVYTTTARQITFGQPGYGSISYPITFNMAEKLIQEFESEQVSYGTYRLVAYID